MPNVEGRLRSYAGLLEEFAAPLGLIAPGDMADLWDRHIMDSLRGLACLRKADREMVDVGSGAGLPGIPLAVACPERYFVLLEPNRRRAGFLELAVERLGLSNANVLVRRIGEADLRVDVCLARAFAPLLATWNACSRLLNPQGQVLYYAGRSLNLDIQAAVGQAGAAIDVCRPAERPEEGPILSISRSAAGSAKEVSEDL